MGSGQERPGALDAGVGLNRAVSLAEVGAQHRPQVGGKAVELGRLLGAGLPVPDGFVVPVSAFEEALRGAGLWSLAEAAHRQADAAQHLHAALQTLRIDASIAQGWVRRAATLGTAVAVRSSGVDEDGPERSFAGQHATLLNVAPAAVPQAVVQCWASLYTDRALAYREGEGPRPGALAVLVQRMVEPQSAGVMFTINPLNGSWREMVVEAVWGLGEGLVGGQMAPHFFVVRRPRTWPGPFRRLAERVRLQVMEEDLPELREHVIRHPDGGTERVPTPSALRHKRTLERPALRRLCRLGLRVERALGAPQDIEWARDRDGQIVLLQARPITASGSPRLHDSVLWTRRFIGERWPEPATPLGWSLLEPLLSWFIAYPATQDRYLGGGPALKLIHGRPYINATVFRHLAFKLPGAPSPQFMMELMPPAEEAAWRRRFAVAPDAAVYSSILWHTLTEQRWRRFRWNPLTNPSEWEDYRRRLDAALPALHRVPTDPQHAIGMVESQLEWVREYIGIHICSLLFANIYWQVLDATLATWLPEQRGLLEGLAISEPGNLTVATHEALYQLAQAATPRDLEALGNGQPLSDGFAAALAAFLEEFGHRAEATWEIMSPRWRSHPEQLAPLLGAQREVTVSPLDRVAQQEVRYAEAMGQMRRALSEPRQSMLERLIRDTRRYLLLRENQRFWFEHLLDAVQRVLLYLGHAACARGWLANADEIRLLTWPEVRGLFDGTEDPAILPGTVARRRSVREADVAMEPPTFLSGDAVAIEAMGDARMQGLGISSGRVRGRVRVLRKVAEGHRLKPGEVLVTHAVDPSWTPLFLIAGAVVLELGSVLSHGAVIAREYEIPAVVNIDGATRRLRDGMDVTVDGHRGLVWVHDEASAEPR